MFVGHFAVAFAAKPAAPRVSLPALIVAAGLADILWMVEGALWLSAVVLYVRARRPNGWAGRYGFWLMIVMLTFLWLASLRGDPPPSLSALAVINTVFFIVVLTWAAWMDRARFRRAT
jgi:hypothetical protein